MILIDAMIACKGDASGAMRCAWASVHECPQKNVGLRSSASSLILTTMEPLPTIDEERMRIAGLAKGIVDGELPPRVGAARITAPVDAAGGPGNLDDEYRDLYADFYGWLSEWDASEAARPGADLPTELVAAYEEEIVRAARKFAVADKTE